MPLRLYLSNAAIIISLLFLDQVSKLWATLSSNLPQFEFLGIRLALQPSYNPYLALSIPVPVADYLPVMLVFFIALLGYWLHTVSEGQTRSYYLALILAGAAGNLIDRFFREGVLDWIEISLGNFTWSSFNLADIIIVVGIVLFLFDSLRKKKENGDEEIRRMG